jgi:hypothetical protein
VEYESRIDKNIKRCVNFWMKVYRLDLLLAHVKDKSVLRSKSFEDNFCSKRGTKNDRNVNSQNMRWVIKKFQYVDQRHIVNKQVVEVFEHNLRTNWIAILLQCLMSVHQHRHQFVNRIEKNNTHSSHDDKHSKWYSGKID